MTETGEHFETVRMSSEPGRRVQATALAEGPEVDLLRSFR
jgi:hypothetical protein